MPFLIVRNDITNMEVDAIVNTANPEAVIGTGVDSAIHKKAGKKLLKARKKIGKISVGQAVVTPAYQLNARYVIHTVGPIWQGDGELESRQLRACYENALMQALGKQCKTIALPLISTGNYGFPKDRALQIAISTISAFLLKHEMMVYLVVFDRQAYALSEKLFDAVESYIDEYYVDTHREIRYESERVISRALFEAECKACPTVSAPLPMEGRSLEDVIEELEDTFSESLIRLIDSRGMTDPEVYKKANIDRKHFSKIRKNKNYKPSKATALALAIAMKLSLDETRDFIGRAGFALTHSSKFDIIVEYFIVNENYDIFELNEVLFAFDEPLIGC